MAAGKRTIGQDGLMCRVRGKRGMLLELEDYNGAKIKRYYNPSQLKVVNAEVEQSKEN